MGETVGGTAEGEDLDEGTIHDVLRNARRRLVIETLQTSEGTVSVSDLAEAVAAKEAGTNPAPKNKRQSVYVSLHQTHLPKLDSLGIVEYDPDSKDVALLDRVEEIEVYMEVVPEYGLSWGEFYFGWGLLGMLVVTGVQIGVPLLATIGVDTIAIAFSTGLMATAAFHVYTHQNRILFQRLLE